MSRIRAIVPGVRVRGVWEKIDFSCDGASSKHKKAAI